MKLFVTWELSDQEFAVLQRLVAAEGKAETVNDYATRVGLKGLKGVLETGVQGLRAAAVETLTDAFDAADPQTQAAALDTLGFAFDETGTVRPKK